MKWEIYGGLRQIEGPPHVRGEMMHKWNKDERIESLYWETETKSKRKVMIRACNQIFTIFKLRPNIGQSALLIFVASSTTAGWQNLWKTIQNPLIEYEDNIC